MEILYIIIALVFGVLQLILFFKFFTMTSQISEIRKKMIDPSEIDIANQMYIVGNMKGVEVEVRKYIHRRLVSLSNEAGGSFYNIRVDKEMKSFCKSIETKFGLEINDIDKIIEIHRPDQSNRNSNVNTIA